MHSGTEPLLPLVLPQLHSIFGMPTQLELTQLLKLRIILQLDVQTYPLLYTF